jgi:predicted CoA-binding protein
MQGWSTMTHENPSHDELRRLLTDAKTIAIVGASSNPTRPSHGIMKKLLAGGYRVFPVNPNETEVLGQRAYASLADVPEPIDIVNVFRRASETPPIADAAIQIGAKALWLQSGITNEETARRAKGLIFVMDECIGVMHSILRIPPRA